MAQNVITVKDIHTQKNLWKGKIRLFNFKAWNRNYKFLPLYKTWKKVVEKIKDPKKEQEDTQPCFVIRNQNNLITLTFQNIKGYNLDNPNLALFWNNNLYFVKEFDYINTSTLYVEIKAQLDFIFSFYSDFWRSSGYAQITNSPLFLNDRTTCREFCQETGRKSIYEWRTQTQPSYSIFQINTENWTGKFSEIKLGGGDEKGGEGNKLSLPIDIGIAPLGSFTKSDPLSATGKKMGMAGNFSGGPILAFLAPEDYHKDGSLYYNKSVTEDWSLPQPFNETPHLLSHHTTLQFYYLNKLLFGASCDLLDIIEKVPDVPKDFSTEEREEALKITNKTYVLRYTLRTTATPAGIYHIFRSGSIRYKWEVDVRQKLQSGKYLQMAIEMGIDVGVGFIKGVLKKWVSDMDKTKLEREIENEEKKRKRLELKSTKQIFEAIGVSKAPDDNPENEQQTERSFKSTLATVSKDVANKKIEPSIFYSNTIDFDYDFSEFANRYSKPILKIRAEWSTDLHDNLKANNNISSSVAQVYNTFNHLGSIIRKGFWKGNFTISGDIGNFFQSIFSQGVFFYEDLDNDFSNPSLIRSQPFREIIADVNPAKVFVSEEITDTKHFREVLEFDPDKSDGWHKTYITFDKIEAQKSFKEKFDPLLDPESIHYSEGIYGNPQESTRSRMSLLWELGKAIYRPIFHLLGINFKGCGWCWNCTYYILKRKNYCTVYNWKCPVDCQLIMVLEENKEKKWKLKKDVCYTIEFNPTDVAINWDEVNESTTELFAEEQNFLNLGTDIEEGVQLQEETNDMSNVEIERVESLVIPEFPISGEGIEKPYEEEEKESDKEKEQEIEKEAERHKEKTKEKAKQKEPEKQQEFWGSEDKEKEK